jgi:AAA family ATP:ADP antiporter
MESDKAPAPSPGPEPLVYRFLGLFSEVRSGEAVTALLLAFNIFLLLVCYYIIKPVRDALINAGRGAEYKSYLSAATAVVLILVVKAFSRLASKVPRQKLIAYVIAFFISNLVLFYGLHLGGIPLGTIGIIFFIWAGVFSVLLPAQFWGFANDIYSEAEGKRLFPLVAFGATAGALAGSQIASSLAKPLGSYRLMLLAGAILAACVVLTLVVHAREVGRIHRKQAGEISAEKPLAKGGGFKLLFADRYLLLIALLIMFLNLVNTNGQYILDKVIGRAAAAAAATSGGMSQADIFLKLYADFFILSNLIAMVIQLFLVARIFKRIGVRGALFVLPIIALGGYSIISFGALFFVVRWTKAMENATDYSLMNTTRHALFLITSREAKYKAKAAIDTFFHRSGDVLSALTVFLGTTFLSFKIESFALVNLAGVALWMFLGILIVRQHRKLSAGEPGAA